MIGLWVMSAGVILAAAPVGRGGPEVHTNLARLSVEGGLRPGLTAGTDRPITALALTADGRLLVGGRFNTWGGVLRSNLVRLLPDGTLDEGFKSDIPGSVWGVRLVRDRILVNGDFRIARQGTRTAKKYLVLVTDTGVDDDASVGTAGPVNALLQTFEGGPPATEYWYAGLGFASNSNLERLSGSRLGTDYAYTAARSGLNSVLALASQPGGRILAGGILGATQGTVGAWLVRYNRDGSLDTSFSPRLNGTVRALAVQADGRILVGGDFTLAGGYPRRGLARLEADGRIDVAFNAGVAGTENPGVRVVLAPASGGILVGGSFRTIAGQRRPSIARLNLDGTLDPSFAGVEEGSGGAVDAIALHPGGDILIGGGFQVVRPRQSSAGMVSTWGRGFGGDWDVFRDSTNFVAIAAGGTHCLALTAEGRVVAWGDDSFGQSSVPADLTNVVSVAAGLQHSLALTAEGRVVCWGANLAGQCRVPAGLTKATLVSAAGDHSIAISANGKFFSWGGSGSRIGETVLTGKTNVIALSAGGSHNLALLDSGKVLAWGDNYYHQTNVPGGLANVVAISAGNAHSLALTAEGRVVAWGDNTYLQRIVPVLEPVRAIAAGGVHSMALTISNRVVVWGANIYGETEVPVGLGSTAAIAAGYAHSMALASRPGGSNGPPTELPRIAVPPGPARIAPGSSLALEVTLTTPSDGTVAYQWRRNGNDIPGATNASFSIPAADVVDAGAYSVVVRNALGGTESSPPALVEIDLPGLALTDGFADRATFTSRQFTGTTTNLTATRESGEPLHAGKPGTNSLWMTWRAPATGVATFRTVGSSFDTLLAVYTGTVLSNLVAVAGNDDRDAFLTSEVRFNATEGVDYQVAVDGYAGAGGVLVLGWSLAEAAPPLPTIAAQPQGRVLVLGETGRLQVQTPTPGVVYQWSRDGTDLPGQTRATLDVVGERDAVGSYRVRVADPAGGAFVTSEEALIEVVDRALAAGARLSADKLADLFLEDGPAAAVEVAAAVGLQGGARLAAPVSQGLPGSGTQVTANTVSTHSQDDPLIPGLPLHATRWFRMRFNLLSAGPATVRLTTSGSDIDTLVAVFTNRESLKLLSRQVVKRGAAGDGDGDVYVSVVRGVDYLVLVDGVEGARGRIELKWATRSASGEETETPPLALLRNGRFRVQIVVPAGSYEWSESPGLEAWRPLWTTNISHGLFEYELPDPPIEATRFFRLAPVR